MIHSTLRSVKKKRDDAYCYLRGGNTLGGATAEALIRCTADALQTDGGPDGIDGVADGIINIEKAIRVLLNAHGELSAALALHQERLQRRTQR
jgi:hypothetical protein